LACAFFTGFGIKVQDAPIVLQRRRPIAAMRQKRDYDAARVKSAHFVRTKRAFLLAFAS
jgi:hypothetical protein